MYWSFFTALKLMHLFFPLFGEILNCFAFRAWPVKHLVCLGLQCFYEYINILVSCSREFTHRVKSVSMATFTSQEVEALENGGNQVQGLISSSLVKGVCFSVLMRLSFFSACKRYIFEGLGPSKAAIA